MGLTFTWPSRDPASMRGAADDSGPAMGDILTHVTVFWKLASRLSRRPPPTRSHTHNWLPPALTSMEPDGAVFGGWEAVQSQCWFKDLFINNRGRGHVPGSSAVTRAMSFAIPCDP